MHYSILFGKIKWQSSQNCTRWKMIFFPPGCNIVSLMLCVKCSTQLYSIIKGWWNIKAQLIITVPRSTANVSGWRNSLLLILHWVLSWHTSSQFRSWVYILCTLSFKLTAVGNVYLHFRYSAKINVYLFLFLIPSFFSDLRTLNLFEVLVSFTNSDTVPFISLILFMSYGFQYSWCVPSKLSIKYANLSLSMLAWNGLM